MGRYFGNAEGGHRPARRTRRIRKLDHIHTLPFGHRNNAESRVSHFLVGITGVEERIQW